MDRTRSGWRRFVAPLDIAAYVTWAAVALDVWQRSAEWPPSSGVDARTVTAGLLLLYIGAFASLRRPQSAAQPHARGVVIVMALIALTLLAVGPPSSSPVLLIILVAVAVARWPLPQALALLLIVNLGSAVVLWRVWDVADPVRIVALYGAFQVFAAVSMHALQRADHTASELRDVNSRLIATRALLAESARDGERLRLSRELHDVAGHKLTALKLNLAALQRDESLAGRRELDVSAALADALLSDVRAVVGQLREHDGIDMRVALARLGEPFPTPRVHVHVDSGARVEDTRQAEALIRTAQEGLTNAARHAAADNVWVTLRSVAGGVELLVEDDGRIEGPPDLGHGLAGMVERLEGLGGRLELARAEAGGLKLRAVLPRAQAT
ncbi:MAG TPA: histidine kinase [Steroidobacteraceae bacterium]|nr:histidine kinase [Steroidobacteraceae bacterium]